MDTFEISLRFFHPSNTSLYENENLASKYVNTVFTQTFRHIHTSIRHSNGGENSIKVLAKILAVSMMM